MSRPIAQAEQVISYLADAQDPGSSTLVDGRQFRVVRLVLAAGDEPAPHIPTSEVLFQCVRGEVELRVSNETCALPEGSMVYLTEGHGHSLKAVRDSVVLLVQLRHGESERTAELTASGERPGGASEKDVVEEASEESFPASDPPSFNPSA